MQRREQREYSWWRADSWNFKGGNADQGLIAHSFLRGAGAGVRVVVAGTDFGARRPRTKSCALGARHFGGFDKPWLLHYTRCLRWFEFLNDSNPETALPSTGSECVPWLNVQKERALDSKEITDWNPCGGAGNSCVV